MNLIKLALLPLFISSWCQSANIVNSTSEDLIQIDVASNDSHWKVKETAKLKRSIFNENNKSRRKHIEKKITNVHSSSSHFLFDEHIDTEMASGPNITNCIWSAYKDSSQLRLQCVSVIITKVATNIPDNITSLHFEKCLESTNLSYPVLEHLRGLQELIISSCSVQYVSPKFFFGLNNLRSLRLSNNLLSSLEPLLFENTPNLRLLNLRGNAFLNVQNVAVAASILRNLSTLELDHNWEVGRILSDEFTSLGNTSLELLSLHGCGIKIAESEALKPLSHLKTLVLGSTLINRTALSNITKDLAFTRIENLQLKNLTYVFPGKTFITEELRPLASTNLTTLSLDSNLIFQLRDYAFPKIKSLRKLILNRCSLSFISSNAFHELTNLKELFLTHNKLGSITFQLPGLHVLDVSSNVDGKMETNSTEKFNLTDLGLVRFVKLRRFTLSKSNYGGPITQNTLKGLTSLEFLVISNTYLSYISQYAFSDLRNLKHLTLSSNYLENLNTMMFVGLGNLTRLHLSSNIIECIEDVFEPLTSLEFISLRDNAIKTLPHNLFNFNMNLQTVLLSKNVITTWDYDIIPTRNSLRVLLLDGNDLDDVTPSMLRLFKCLDVLDLSNNPFKCNTCGMKRFRDWILDSENTTIQNLNRSSELYTCTYFDDGKAVPILNITILEDLCWIEPRKTVLIICISVISVVVLLLVICAYKLRLKFGDLMHRLRNHFHSYREFKVSMNNGQVEIETVH